MSHHKVRITVNGTVGEDEIESRLLLVHYLRETRGLTGTHVGCDTSNCGACTVMLDGRTVKSCTVLAVAADGADVLTVEGLAGGGELSPVQEGFRQCHGLQCGYCTPGMVMAATGLLLENEAPDESEIREGIEGNLCRCTGYDMIVDSVRWAAENGGPGEAAERHAQGRGVLTPDEAAPAPSGTQPAPVVTP
ncbi:(2Fe-2S)-binding protein [Pseudonocardia lutea]|jgi:carbon-monoxide dehydrogenase small subunit|uniref:(2Fe-2S)-binding protein n=1 Tax=Pseudonocardia lutea TaxID=2172015 RepID=A0ABW1IH31_9PSEU